MSKLNIENKLPDFENYYPEKFFKELRDFGLQKRKISKNLVKDIEKYLGLKINKDTAAWLDFFGKHIMKKDFYSGNPRFGEGFLGAIGFADSERWELSPLYYSPEDFPIENIYMRNLSLISYFSNTFYIGCDGGGQGYFVELSENSSEVFLYEDSGFFSFLTDSISSFFYLNRVYFQVQSIYKKLDIDGGDIENGDYNAEDFAEVIDGVKKLSKHINLDDDSEYSGELSCISSITPKTSPKSRTIELFERADWLIWLFQGFYLEECIKEAKKLSFPEDKKNELTQADKIYWLWHLFLFDDPQFPDFLAECKNDEIFIVNKTSALLEKLVNNKMMSEELEFFIQAKEQVSKIK